MASWAAAASLAQNVDQRVDVDVAARYVADALAAACLAVHRGGHGGGSGSLGNDVRSRDKVAESVDDLCERDDQRVVEECAHQRPHLRQYSAAADSIDETRRAFYGHGA